MKATTKNLVKSTYELFMSFNPAVVNSVFYHQLLINSDAKRERYYVANFISSFSFSMALVLEQVQDDSILFSKLEESGNYLLSTLIDEYFPFV